MSSLRYWLRSLLGVALASAAVVVVAWTAWAWSRTSLCVPGDERLVCEPDGEAFAVVLAITLLLVVPIASGIFAGRTKPAGSHLGLLTYALALIAAGGAGLWSAVGEAPGTDTTQIIGAAIAAATLSFGPFLLLGGIATTGRSTSRAEVRKASEAVLAANGGDLTRSLAAVKAAQGQQRSGGATATAQPKQIQLGTLAAQLSQIANASARSGGDELAAKLRQLDDLRKSGLLSAEEHTRKRRELLDQM